MFLTHKCSAVFFFSFILQRSEKVYMKFQNDKLHAQRTGLKFNATFYEYDERLRPMRFAKRMRAYVCAQRATEIRVNTHTRDVTRDKQNCPL